MRSFVAPLALSVGLLQAFVAGCSPDRDSLSDSSPTGGASYGGGPMGGSLTGGTTAGGGVGMGGTKTGGSSSGGMSGLGGVGIGGEPLATGGNGPAQGAAGGAVGESGGGSSGGSSAAAGGSSEVSPLTIFIAGDSTVSTYADTASTTDQAGWGQMLPELLKPLAKVDNRAIGGRTARRFVEEGALAAIWEDATAGDYLLVQFGTNDGNKTATYEFNGQTIPYYLDPNTDFKTYLMQYVDGARARNVIAVFVTPPPRNSAYCTGGNGTGAHAQAMRDLGEAEDVPVLDLNAESVAYLTAICPSPTPEDFFLLRGDGSVDGTHFQENGAKKLASFVAAEMRRVSLPLVDYLK